MDKNTHHLDIIKNIEGEQLSSVIFVQDYLQLDFDGNKFTCYVFPVICLNEERIESNDLNYKNLLCTFISKNVKEIIIEDEKFFKIIFIDNSSIIVILENGESEALYFTDIDGNWMVY